MPDTATPTNATTHEPRRLRIATGRAERHGARTLILCATSEGVSVTTFPAVTR
ncbi:hypothetical protein [Streptomyces sp. NPDC056401]|uniref:hypothetical protein n=1 Tax=Streptomyces sp. NPDC056401 TaxID=3345809 RepID=UPI0035D7EFC4